MTPTFLFSLPLFLFVFPLFVFKFTHLSSASKTFSYSLFHQYCLTPSLFCSLLWYFSLNRLPVSSLLLPLTCISLQLPSIHLSIFYQHFILSHHLLCFLMCPYLFFQIPHFTCTYKHCFPELHLHIEALIPSNSFLCPLFH